MLLMPGPEQIFSLDFMVDKLEIHQAGDVGVLVGNLRLTVNSFDAGSDEIQSSIWEGLLPLHSGLAWGGVGPFRGRLFYCSFYTFLYSIHIYQYVKTHYDLNNNC